MHTSAHLHMQTDFSCLCSSLASQCNVAKMVFRNEQRHLQFVHADSCMVITQYLFSLLDSQKTRARFSQSNLLTELTGPRGPWGEYGCGSDAGICHACSGHTVFGIWDAATFACFKQVAWMQICAIATNRHSRLLASNPTEEGDTVIAAYKQSH